MPAWLSKVGRGWPGRCLVLVAEDSALSLSRKDRTGPVLCENSLFLWKTCLKLTPKQTAGPALCKEISLLATTDFSVPSRRLLRQERAYIPHSRVQKMRTRHRWELWRWFSEAYEQNNNEISGAEHHSKGTHFLTCWLHQEEVFWLRTSRSLILLY